MPFEPTPGEDQRALVAAAALEDAPLPGADAEYETARKAPAR